MIPGGSDEPARGNDPAALAGRAAPAPGADAPGEGGPFGRATAVAGPGAARADVAPRARELALYTRGRLSHPRAARRGSARAGRADDRRTPRGAEGRVPRRGRSTDRDHRPGSPAGVLGVGP